MEFISEVPEEFTRLKVKCCFLQGCTSLVDSTCIQPSEWQGSPSVSFSLPSSPPSWCSISSMSPGKTFQTRTILQGFKVWPDTSHGQLFASACTTHTSYMESSEKAHRKRNLCLLTCYIWSSIFSFSRCLFRRVLSLQVNNDSWEHTLRSIPKRESVRLRLGVFTDRNM